MFHYGLNKPVNQEIQIQAFHLLISCLGAIAVIAHQPAQYRPVLLPGMGLIVLLVRSPSGKANAVSLAVR